VAAPDASRTACLVAEGLALLDPSLKGRQLPRTLLQFAGPGSPLAPLQASLAARARPQAAGLGSPGACSPGCRSPIGQHRSTVRLQPGSEAPRRHRGRTGPALRAGWSWPEPMGTSSCCCCPWACFSTGTGPAFGPADQQRPLTEGKRQRTALWLKKFGGPWTGLHPILSSPPAARQQTRGSCPRGGGPRLKQTRTGTGGPIHSIWLFACGGQPPLPGGGGSAWWA